MNRSFLSSGLTPDVPFVCPHLKRGDDASLRYGYAHVLNFCHRPAKPQPVSLSHQSQVCFSGEYGDCPLFSVSDWKGPLPPQMRAINLVRRKHMKNRIFIPLGLALLLSFLVFAALWGFDLRAPAGLFWGSNAQDLPTPTLIPTASVTSTASLLPPTRIRLPLLPPMTVTLTGTRVSASPTTLIQTQMPVPVTGGAATQTPAGSPTLTIGPRLETPFGPGKRYLVHLVAPGENIDYLARTYKTSLEMLKEINFVRQQRILWEDEVIVIQPGQTDPAEVLPLKALYIEYNITLEDFLKTHPVDEDFLRQANEISGGMLRAGRWVIIPR